MKRKELKNLAQKIAKYEYINETSTNEDEIEEAKIQIMNLSGRINNIEDMVELDDLVQSFLSQMLDN